MLRTLKLGSACLLATAVMYVSSAKGDCDILCREVVRIWQPDAEHGCIKLQTKDCLCCVMGGCDTTNGPGEANCKRFVYVQRYHDLIGCQSACAGATPPCQAQNGIENSELKVWGSVHSCETDEPPMTDPPGGP